MLLNQKIGSKALAAAVLVLLLGWVSTADARQFSMSGSWAMQKAQGVWLPIALGPGGIGGGGLVTATGAAPATLTVPTNRFQGTGNLGFPLPQTSIVQLTTQFYFNGPQAPGVLRAGHWVGTRAFPNFAWCPGAAANPACTDWRSTGQGAATGMGTQHGLIRYTSGVQQFGGTMNTVRGGVGTLSLLVGVSPTQVQHNALGAVGTVPQMPGGAYYATTLRLRAGGPITQSPGFSVGGMITVPGTQVNTGAGTSNLFVGFPFTTGQVYVKVSLGQTGYETLTVTGSDQRTPLGAGNITLVAGGLVQRLVQGRTLPYEDTVKMKLSHPAPSMSPAGVAVGAVLMVLAVGYAMRRRF
jgi:hypothetical protein